MKTIFATALIAASASATSIKIPDYSAGVIYGFTGANHLSEIEACYHGTHDIASDAQDALNDIESGDWLKGINAIHKFIKDLPQALTTCKNIDDDIARIQAWAEIFTQPEHLFKEASKNYLLHRKTIHSDIDSEKQHWANEQYFNAGIDTALALTEILPIEDSQVTLQYLAPYVHTDIALGMPVLAAPKWAAGVVFGLVGDNNLTEIEACYHDGKDVAPRVEQAILDLVGGDFTKAALDLVGIIKDLPSLLSDCRGMDDDIAAIEAWAQIFTNKAKLVAVVTKNWALHRKGIKADIADAKAAWALHEYFSAGVTSADIVIKAVGPINPVVSPNWAVANFDAMAIPDFIAGFIFGMTGDNDLVEIEACYQGSQQIDAMLKLAIGDLKKGGWNNYTQAALEFGLAALMFPQALNTCEGMGDDIAAIEEWAQIFTDIPKLTATVTKSYLLHKKKVQADIDDIEADQAAGNYWQMGIDTAELLTLLVGPIQ